MHTSTGRVRSGIAALVILSACAGAESRPPVAPNLLSPAPAAASGDECVVGMIRGDIVRGQDLLEALAPYTPRWLPPGFGLLVGWQPPDDDVIGGPSAGAIWTDRECRQIQVEIFPGAAAEESPRPDGEWRLIDRGECTFGDLRNVLCVSYHAQANGDAINLMTADLPDEVTRRIVEGIDVSA